MTFKIDYRSSEFMTVVKQNIALSCVLHSVV